MYKSTLLAMALVLAGAVATVASADMYTDGGNRLVDLQNNDGGWDTPLTNGNPDTGSLSNTVGPIGMGLLSAYYQTGDASHLAAAIDAGEFVINGSTPHDSANGIFAHALSEETGENSYANHVRTNYYDALADGTYELSSRSTRSTTAFDTAGFASYIVSSRTNLGYTNLATWDLGLAAIGAQRLGADTSVWVAALQAQIEAMSSGAVFEVMGLAGGVWALAELGVDFDPKVGDFVDADSTADLAAMLAGYQIEGGGFASPGGLIAPDRVNESVQDTAYAIRALEAFDNALYGDTIQGAVGYLSSIQLATGGWENNPGTGENNEITANALWGMSAPVPEPATLVLLGMGLAGLVMRRSRKQV